MQHKERVQGYFKSHPDTDVFFVTSDGAAFFTKENAEAYAQVFKTKEEREVQAVTRAEVLDAEPVTDAPAKKTAGTKNKSSNQNAE